MYVDVVDLDVRENHCSCEHAHANVNQRVRGASLLVAKQSLQLEFVLQMFQIDKKQYQTCSWWGAIVPAAVFVLQMAWDLVPRLIAASQYVLYSEYQIVLRAAQRQLQNLLCDLANGMAHANPRSWADLAVDVPTGRVEYRVKVVYTKIFLTEEAIFDI